MNELIQPDTEEYPYSLFEVCGLELEYMIVDSSTLDVMPVCDRLLAEIAGKTVNEVYPDGETGFAAWSNELALHVLEFKTINPATDIPGLRDVFKSQVNRALTMLESYDAVLMPTAMHPWMNPDREFKIWPHGSRKIYNTFDSIFGCTGHGWSNLQSVHINMPFRDSAEFTALHNAIRLVLPLMSGLTASSPFAGGNYTGFNDYRMEMYRTNSAKIPSITGLIVPEPTTGINNYRDSVLSVIYSDLKEYDPTGIISHEWVNARGCIPRFERGSIEIRTLDIQECPAADIACAELFIATVKALVEENFISAGELTGLSTDALHLILIDTITHGDRSVIKNMEYLSLFGIRETITVSQFWQYMAGKLFSTGAELLKELDNIFKNGNLSSRILSAAGDKPGHEKLFEVYKQLCLCLKEGRQFIP